MKPKLREADRLEVTALVDNYADMLLMDSSEVVQRPDAAPKALLAEHGLSYFIKIHAGEERAHAVMGGFHLTGAVFESVIPPTVEAMKKINPDFIIPAHCSGWKATNEFAGQMPEQFILNSVGTTYVFS